LSSCPTDGQLVENYLRPVLHREESREDKKSRWKLGRSNPAAVNTGLPLMNPWDLPGMYSFPDYAIYFILRAIPIVEPAAGYKLIAMSSITIL
jgi:hypothetical protein